MSDSEATSAGVSRRKLCFGGSFNPIHVGHLLVARAVAERQNFQKVLLIPSALPPHKQSSADLAAAAHRLKMCELVAKNDPLFEVSDIETSRSGPSFTLETARALARQGWEEVNWLIGADMLRDLPNWHRPVELMQEVKLWVAQRPGYEIDWAALPPDFRGLGAHVIPAPLIQFSGTEIRQRIKAGRTIRYMVPPEVERYIVDHRVYAGGES